MIGFLTSIFAGGATGLIGGVFSRLFDWLGQRERNKQKVIDNDFELQRMDKEKDMLSMEIERDAIIAKTGANAKIEVAASKALAVSYEADKATYTPEGVELGKTSVVMLVIVDFVRGLIRPGLTIYLCILATMIYLQSVEMMNLAVSATSVTEATIPAIKAIAVVDTCVNAILYLTSVAVTWWFGSRPKKSG